MVTVSIRELRLHASELAQRVVAGERVIVTRAGRPVAELHPVRRASLTSAEILERWRHLPPLDPVAWLHDLDAVIDPSV